MFVNIYKSKDKIIFLPGIVAEGWKMFFTKKYATLTTNELSIESISSVFSYRIDLVWNVSDEDLLTYEPLASEGYPDFKTLFRKTELLILEIQDYHAELFFWKKVKRWYESTPVDNIVYELGDWKLFKKIYELLVNC